MIIEKEVILVENKKIKIAEFYEQIFSDTKLKEKIEIKAKAIVAEEDLRKLIREEIMPLMKKFNVNFSEKELLSYEEETLKELSEETLEGISGGRGIAIKPLLGLGILSFSLFGGIGLESFAAGGSGKGKTVQQQEVTSSDDENGNDNDDEEESDDGIDVEDIDPKDIVIGIDKDGISFKYNKKHMNKSTFFRFANEFQESGKVYSPNKANRSRALKCLLFNKNVMEALKDEPELLADVYKNMKELREDEDAWDNLPQEIKDKVNNFLKEYEKSHDDDIDVNNQEVKDIADKISTEIDEDGVSFKYDDRYISESKFFELADVYQQDYTFSSSFKNLTHEKALKGILINENAMEEWKNNQKLCDKVFVITEKKIRSNANVWDKLSKKVKDKVAGFSNEYLNNKDISPKDVKINIDENQRFNFNGFSLNGKIISTGALLKIAENYKQKNDEYIPDGDDITLSTAMKCILFNKNVKENLESEPGLFDEVYEIVEVFGENEQALNSLPPEVKDEVAEFLEEYDDYNETPRISSKPQKGNLEKNKKSGIAVDDEDDDDYADNNSDFSNDDDDDEPPRVSRKRPQKGKQAQNKKSSESSLDIDDDEPPRISKKRSQRGEQEQSKEISVVNANNDNATVEQTNDTNKKGNKKAKAVGKKGNKKRRFKKRPRKKVTSSNVKESTQNNDDTIIGNDEDANSDDVAKDIKSSDNNSAVNNVTSDKDHGDVAIEKNNSNNSNENDDSSSVNVNIPKEDNENNNSDNAKVLEDNNNYDHMSSNSHPSSNFDDDNDNDNDNANNIDLDNNDEQSSNTDNDNLNYAPQILSIKYFDLIKNIRDNLDGQQQEDYDKATRQRGAEVGTNGSSIFIFIRNDNNPNKVTITHVFTPSSLVFTDFPSEIMTDNKTTKQVFYKNGKTEDVDMNETVKVVNINLDNNADLALKNLAEEFNRKIRIANINYVACNKPNRFGFGGDAIDVAAKNLISVLKQIKSLDELDETSKKDVITDIKYLHSYVKPNGNEFYLEDTFKSYTGINNLELIEQFYESGKNE